MNNIVSDPSYRFMFLKENLNEFNTEDRSINNGIFFSVWKKIPRIFKSTKSKLFGIDFEQKYFYHYKNKCKTEGRSINNGIFFGAWKKFPEYF